MRSDRLPVLATGRDADAYVAWKREFATLTTVELQHYIGYAATALSDRFKAENPDAPPMAYFKANGILHALWALMDEVKEQANA